MQAVLLLSVTLPRGHIFVKKISTTDNQNYRFEIIRINKSKMKMNKKALKLE
jgi:hypothetical protein